MGICLNRISRKKCLILLFNSKLFCVGKTVCQGFTFTCLQGLIENRTLFKKWEQTKTPWEGEGKSWWNEGFSNIGIIFNIYENNEHTQINLKASETFCSYVRNILLEWLLREYHCLMIPGSLAFNTEYQH